jgi:hypothetical protein
MYKPPPPSFSSPYPFPLLTVQNLDHGETRKREFRASLTHKRRRREKEHYEKTAGQHAVMAHFERLTDAEGVII